MLNIEYHKSFKKSYAKLSEKLKVAVDQRLTLFIMDPYNVLLNNHALKGEYIGARSINVTGNYRIIYQEKSNILILLIDVGTHSQLYK